MKSNGNFYGIGIHSDTIKASFLAVISALNRYFLSVLKIHEYQAKEILRKYNIPLPQGSVAFSVEEALNIEKISYFFQKTFGSS